MDKKQKEIDIKKWLESEEINKDLCGSYPFCKYCDKSLEDPCSHAYKKMLEENNKTKGENKTEVRQVEKTIPSETKKKKYKVLSFQEKLDKAKKETRQILKDVVSDLESLELKTKIHKRFLSVTHKNHLCAWISITRNSLKIHLPLNPKKIHLEFKPMDYSDKKIYIDNPYTLKLNVKRSRKALDTLLPIVTNNIDKA